MAEAKKGQDPSIVEVGVGRPARLTSIVAALIHNIGKAQPVDQQIEGVIETDSLPVIQQAKRAIKYRRN